MSIEIRPYQAGDENAICELFEQVFGRTMSRQFWHWRYVDHPAGGPHASLAWDGDRLAGHYAVMASALAIGGERKLAALSMTTMVHPDYRGQRLFERTAEDLYQRLGAESFEAVYGFPNANSLRGFIGRLGWRGVYEVPTLEAAVDTLPVIKAAQIQAVTRFDEPFDEYWDEIKRSNDVWVWRDSRYLQWRFMNHPEQQYEAAAWYERGRVRGMVVVKAYEDLSLDIVELTATDNEVVRSLVAWAADRAKRKSLRRLATWAPLHAPSRLALESLGFKATAPVTYFGCKPLSDASGMDLHDPRRWVLAMSDSDVY